MIRILALLVLVVFLLSSLIGYLTGNNSPWYVDLGTALLTAGLVLLIFRRKRKTMMVLLPGGEGLLTIEGKDYPFLYLVGRTDAGLGFQGETQGDNYAVRFTAHLSQEGKVEADPEVIKELERDATVTGVVKFGEHRVPIKLRKEPARCSCDSEIPCWRGERYTGVYYQHSEMLIQIVCIVIHWRRKERVPVKEHKEKRFPSLLPNPIPTPSTMTSVSSYQLKAP